MTYTIHLDLSEDEIFQLMLTNKRTNEGHLFEGKSYGMVLSKAYSRMLKDLKQ